MNPNIESSWRKKLWIIIFEADTPLGKTFDVVLIWAIIISVLSVSLESVNSIRIDYGEYLLFIEWAFTILFTIEYFLRLLCVENRKKYAFSFFGIIDLLAILPTYLSYFFVGAHSLLVIRSFRLLRVFRVLKLTHFLKQANVLSDALKASGPKITVFIVGVLATVITMGTVMYLVEGPENDFTSIPKSIYWAIVTMTTVGFGDIYPKTVLGQFLASILMILGYGVLAVPTGIVSLEIAKATKDSEATSGAVMLCKSCDNSERDPKAKYCKFCSQPLEFTK